MEKNSNQKNQAEDIRDKKRKGSLFQEAAILAVTAAAAAAAAFLYGKTQIETVKIVLFMVIASGCVIFSIEESREQKTFLFDNELYLWRFTVIYLLFLTGSVLFPLLPSAGWPFLATFVGLMLFSNQVIGMCAGTTLLMLTVLLGNAPSIDTLFVYFVSGMTGVIVFSYVNEEFKVGVPILVSLLMQVICLCIQSVLLVNETLAVQMFLIPLVNTMVCLILLLIILKFFSYSTIYRHRDMYIDINDPEGQLLSELKSFSKEEYFHAVHTAYLCDRMAKKLNLNAAVAKACGYYHKIGVLKGENTWENVSAVLIENEFPQPVKDILEEYLEENKRLISKEAVILMFSETVISSLTYLFSKNPNNELDYDKLIQAVFKKKMESGIIRYSNITLGELDEMKKILTRENLYYDFLR